MEHYRFPEHRAYKVGFAIAMLALLLLTRDAMYSMMVWDFYTCQFLSLGILAVMGMAFLWHNRKQLKKVLLDPRMLVIVLASLAMLLPMLIKRDWQLMYFSILLGVYVAVFLSYFTTIEEVARWYVVTMSILGIWSVLASYVLRIFLDNGMLSVPVVTNAVDVLFHNFIFTVVPDTYVRHRNFGFFREPGVYQFFLLIGIYLNNYIVSWKENWKLWTINGVLALTLVTTFATGGVIELGLLAVVMFLDKKWYRDKRGRWIAALLVGSVAGVVVISVIHRNALYHAIYEMTMKFVNNPESTGSRISSILLGMEMFFQSPIVGAPIHAVLHATVDNTASSMILYDIFGFLGGSVHVLGWIALVWKKERKIWSNLALLVILFMSFNTQNLTWNIFFWLFPMMALTERGVQLIPLPSRKV